MRAAIENRIVLTGVGDVERDVGVAYGIARVLRVVELELDTTERKQTARSASALRAVRQF